MAARRGGRSSQVSRVTLLTLSEMQGEYHGVRHKVKLVVKVMHVSLEPCLFTALSSLEAIASEDITEGSAYNCSLRLTHLNIFNNRALFILISCISELNLLQF